MFMAIRRTTTIPVSRQMAFHLENQDWICEDATAHPPSVVVYPESTEDVVKVVKIANRYKMPITPYSGGTSLEGNFRSVRIPNIHLSTHLLTTERSMVRVAFCWWDLCGYVSNGPYSWDSRYVRAAYLTCDEIVNCCIAEADSDLVCQPGARWMDINALLKSKGSILSRWYSLNTDIRVIRRNTPVFPCPCHHICCVFSLTSI